MTRFERLEDELRSDPRAWLVTGVAGFIGSNLLNHLLDLGQTVIGLDDFSSGYRRNLQEVLDGPPARRKRFELIEGDILDLATCKEACREVRHVLHQAAIGSVPRSVLEPGLVTRVNVEGTLNVMMAARDRGVKRVVYASSSAVFGSAPTLPLAEDAVGAMLSPYAVSKYANEKYADVFSRIFGVETVGLRYFNVFGPRQDPLGSYAAVIPQWIHAQLTGEPCFIHGDGETTRDFVPVSAVVQANLLAATAPLPLGPARIYNVGAGRRTSLNLLQTMLSAAVARLRPDLRQRPPVHDEFREGDIRHSQADIGRIHAELEYAADEELAAALEQTVAWYLQRLNAPDLLARIA
jgi:UDP-N-acetylglucosamine 4-epimerase